MGWKTILAVIGGLLLIICGEALKQEMTQWEQLLEFKFIMYIGVQVAGLISVFVGGLYTPKPNGGIK